MSIPPMMATQLIVTSRAEKRARRRSSSPPPQNERVDPRCDGPLALALETAHDRDGSVRTGSAGRVLGRFGRSQCKIRGQYIELAVGLRAVRRRGAFVVFGDGELAIGQGVVEQLRDEVAVCVGGSNTGALRFG